MDDHIEEPFPHWADTRITDGQYMHIRAALPTKDGRRCGNAVILGIAQSSILDGRTIAIVCTDAGNVLRLLETELQELFHPPQWTMAELLPGHQQAAWELTAFVDPNLKDLRT